VFKKGENKRKREKKRKRKMEVRGHFDLGKRESSRRRGIKKRDGFAFFLCGGHYTLR
jgi:hypothetical protein